MFLEALIYEETKASEELEFFNLGKWWRHMKTNNLYGASAFE